VVGHVGDGKPGVLEKPGSTHQARQRQVALWCREAGAEEATHHAARQHAEVTRQHAHVGDARRAEKDRLEEPPAVFGRTSEIHGELAKDAALAAITGIRHERTAQLPPSGRLSYVNEAANARLPERQHGVRRAALEVAEERDRRDARKLADQCRDARRERAGAAYGHEHGLYGT